MKKILTLILFTIALFANSCMDPVSYAYQIELSLNHIETTNYEYRATINDKNNKILASFRLDKQNSYISTYKSSGMGPQHDLKNPEYEGLKAILNQISSGGSIIIKEKSGTDETKYIAKYTIPYSKDEVKDTTKSTDMYRHYKITLDWNKKVPIPQ